MAKSGEIFQYIKKAADRLRMTTVKIFKPDVTIVTSWLASYNILTTKGGLSLNFRLILKLNCSNLKNSSHNTISKTYRSLNLNTALEYMNCYVNI